MTHDIARHSEITISEPEFIRLPKSPARCQWSGLTRAALNQLILSSAANNFRPPVRSVVLKSCPRNSRGIRLIVYKSLKEHLHGQGESSSVAPATAP